MLIEDPGYRASRVCAIFSLPSHLEYLHDGPLVYLELFTQLDNPVSTVHHMHMLSTDRRDGRRRSLVVPIALVAMACHLVPVFDQFDVDTLGPTVDVLSSARRCYLNHYFNHFFFQFTRYWRRLC
jgi:hypothetical protein